MEATAAVPGSSSSSGRFSQEGLITALVNSRIKQDPFFGQREFTEKQVIETLRMGKFEASNFNPKILCEVLIQECDVFRIPRSKDRYSSRMANFMEKTDEENLLEMIELGYVKFEWGNVGGIDSDCSSNGGDGTAPLSSSFSSSSSSSDEDEFNSFRVLKKMNTRSYFPPQQRASMNVFVDFDIERIALDNLTMFPEISIVKTVCNKIFDDLELKAIVKTMPVKPSRRKTNSDVWCQLRYEYFNKNMSSSAIEFAKRVMGLSESCAKSIADKSMGIKVYFSIRDNMTTSNPWSHCPLLHVGANFKTENMSNFFYDNSSTATTKVSHIESLRENQGELEENTCCFYSQKNPTLEVPSKLYEVEAVIRGVLDESACLYGDDDKVREVSDELLINMAFSHPKARIRHVITTYVTCVFPVLKTTVKKTHIDPQTREIMVGEDANMSSPTCPETKSGISVPGAGGYRASRKISLATDVCFACNNQTCNGCNKLSHRHIMPYDSPRASCITVDSFKRKLRQDTVKLFGTEKIDEYIMTPCGRASVVHNYYCSGVKIRAPLKVSDYVVEDKKTKLVLIGKVKDVVTGFCSDSWSSGSGSISEDWRARGREVDVGVSLNYRQTGSTVGSEQTRKRVFYGEKSDLYNKDTVIQLSGNTFRDILVDEVSVKCVRRCLESETIHQKQQIFYHLNALFAFLEENLGSLEDKKRVVDFAASVASSSEEMEKVVPGDYRTFNVKKALNVVNHLLCLVRDNNHATLFTAMNKSVLTASSLVLLGSRCAISNISECKNMDVRQIVAASKGMELSLVTDEELVEYTPLKGAVSATTAPNDKLSEKACHTWWCKLKKPSVTSNNKNNVTHIKRQTTIHTQVYSSPSPGYPVYVPPNRRIERNVEQDV